MKPQVGLSQEQVNKLKGDTGINQGLLAQYKPVAPITPSSLNSNETPAQVTAPTVPTQATSLQGSIQAGTDQFTKNQERKYEEALTNKQSSLQDYVGSLLEPGEIARTVDKYGQKGGVDTLEVELNDINDQIRQEQTALARQTEAIQKEAGLTKGQIDQQVAEVGRVSTRKQADLYIIQQGVQGRYDSAKAIADRAVQAEMEVVKQKQDILKTLYEDNKDLFTTAEQRLYDTKLADRNRALDAEERELQNVSDLSINALKNGAPTSIVTAMRNAGSVTEALAVGGRYVDLLDRQAKLQQISASRTNQLLALASAGDSNAIDSLGFDPRSVEEEIDPVTKRQLNETVDGTTELLTLAKKYRGLVDTYGYTNELFGSPQVLGQVESLRAQMTAAYKKAATLGTLDRGVLDLMQQLLGEAPVSSVSGTFWPGGSPGMFSNLTTRKGDKIVASIDEFILTTETAQAKAMLRLGIDPTLEPLPEEDSEAVDQAYGNGTAFSPADYY